MFTETFFKAHHHYFSDPGDTWMQAFLRLCVPSNFVNPKQFKIEAVEALRKSNVYKTTKLSAEQVEGNLLDSQRLSVPAFCALAHLHNVHVAVVLGQMYFATGALFSHYVDARGEVHPAPSSRFSDLFHVQHVGKPLNALSYYSAGDLETIAAKIRTPKGTKPNTYNGITSYVREKLTAL